MTIPNFYEGLKTQRDSGPKLQRLFSRWNDASHGRPNISPIGGIEELQNVVDTLIDPPAMGHAGIRLITAEASVCRDNVLTHLLSSMVEDQNSVTGLRIMLDRSSPLEKPSSGCLIAPTLRETKREAQLYRLEIELILKIKPDPYIKYMGELLNVVRQLFDRDSRYLNQLCQPLFFCVRNSL